MGQKIELEIKKQSNIDIGIEKNNKLNLELKKSTGTSNYPSLTNKPSINGIIVLGDKLGEDYKLQDLMDEITESEIDKLIYGG